LGYIGDDGGEATTEEVRGGGTSDDKDDDWMQIGTKPWKALALRWWKTSKRKRVEDQWVYQLGDPTPLAAGEPPAGRKGGARAEVERGC
jgi:hypothetical protein